MNTNLDSIIEKGETVDSKVLVSFSADIKGEITFLKNSLQFKDKKIEDAAQTIDEYRNAYKEKVQNLTNEITDLKDRVFPREMYISKKTVTTTNPPVGDTKNIIVTVFGILQ